MREDVMARFDGALAHQLDFEDFTTTLYSTAQPGRLAPARPVLRLAGGGHRLRGPDKYRVLEHRRRQAQIAARRALELF
jgi:hypothetical protein